MGHGKYELENDVKLVYEIMEKELPYSNGKQEEGIMRWSEKQIKMT